MIDIPVRILNALLMIALPLALGVYLSRKFGVGWRLFGIGAVTFIASQVFHIPFNYYVLNPFIEWAGLSPPGSTFQWIAISILFGLSAGVFEETARYIVYRFKLKTEPDRTWHSALMLGAGHGGSEAILLGVLAAYSFFRLLALRDADLSAFFSGDELAIAEMQVSLFWSLPWYGAILGAVERAAAICFHLSATVLVLQAFRRKNILWLLLAIGWHTVLNAVTVFGMQTWGMYVTEVLIVGMAIFGLWIIFVLRDPPDTEEDHHPEIAKPLEGEIPPEKPSIEKLEDSRYD